MSCFHGQMNEYKSIALDRFDGKNLKCTAFFLSHCHKDHMVGLNTSAFHERLKSRNDLHLYCTEISRLLLLADEEYIHLEKFICVLDVGVSSHICVPVIGEKEEDSYVCVTPISAGHCLGSVMFLFEGNEGTVVYTGDFRWEVNQAASISAFQYRESVKNIWAMYIDTTFCTPDAFHIPTRNECVEAAFTLISDWLKKGLCDVVSISCPAKYGHEHFLLELAKKLNTKVHVPSWKVDVYNSIPEMKGYFTDDAAQAILHSCSTRSGFIKTSVLPCGYQLPEGEKLKLLTIRPSTMWFISTKTKCSSSDLVVAPAMQRGLHRVCYSMHSSYSEIRDLVSFIKPQKVFPNVLPASDRDMMVVQKRLESFIDYPNKFRLLSSSISDEIKPLGTLRKIQRITSKFLRINSFDSGSDELVFSSQELSPRKSSTSHYKAIKSTPSPDKEQESKSSDTSPSHDLSQESHSSYSRSADGHYDEEIDLFFDEGEGKDNILKDENDNGKLEETERKEESIRSYVSGESETEDTDDEDDEKIYNSVKNIKSVRCNKNVSNTLEMFKSICNNEDRKSKDSVSGNTCSNGVGDGQLESETGIRVKSLNFKHEHVDKDEHREDPNLRQIFPLFKDCDKNSVKKYNEKQQIEQDEERVDDDCSDNDIIPNSQEYTIDKNLSVRDKSGQKQNVIDGKSSEMKLNVDKESKDYVEINDCLDIRLNNSEDYQSSHNSKNVVFKHDIDSEVNDDDVNCEKVHKNSVSEMFNLQTSNNFTVFSKVSDKQYKNNDIMHCHFTNQFHPSTSIPTTSKSLSHNVGNCSPPSVISVEENKNFEQDDEGVEFLHEHKSILFSTTQVQSGWLSKRSGKNQHGLISNFCSNAANKFPKRTTLDKSKIPHKRKVEESESRIWCSKLNKRKDRLLKYGDINCDQSHHQEDKEVVDLT